MTYFGTILNLMNEIKDQKATEFSSMLVEIPDEIVCPFCYELMIDSIENTPTLLEPCHHIICSSCLRSDNRCPICMAPVTSSNINEPTRKLSNAICNQLGLA